MLFRGEPANRITRLFAGLVLMGISAPMFLFRNPLSLLIGFTICGIGLGVVVWQGWQMWRERPDPYDLNRLWDKPAPEPDKPLETPADEDLIYCHRCGVSMSEIHAICPQCGNFLNS
ncbi:MAG: hypothetical protein JWL77_1087 [Chthonomonadaceae bacterium]|nr:hypothetical protein [Chthonomonadaceae bacterium]